MQGVAAKNDASPVRGHAAGDQCRPARARRRARRSAAAISKQLRLLDKVVRYRFGDSPELMGAWESARNASLRSARRVAGPFNITNEPQSGAGGSATPKAA